jgi:hypothetical protein
MLFANTTLESGEFVELRGESLETLAMVFAEFGEPEASATVYDEPGFVRGWINGAGNYLATKKGVSS